MKKTVIFLVIILLTAGCGSFTVSRISGDVEVPEVKKAIGKYWIHFQELNETRFNNNKNLARSFLSGNLDDKSRLKLKGFVKDAKYSKDCFLLFSISHEKNTLKQNDVTLKIKNDNGLPVPFESWLLTYRYTSSKYGSFYIHKWIIRLNNPAPAKAAYIADVMIRNQKIKYRITH